MLDTCISLVGCNGSRRRNEQDSLGCDAELRGRSTQKKKIFFSSLRCSKHFCDVCTLDENGTLASITIFISLFAVASRPLAAEAIARRPDRNA